MFKRIQKKQKKAELEEELGLDDDVKQTLGLGMHDTDTDESESESDSESESGEDIAGDLGIGVDGGAGEDSEGVEEDAEEDEEENGLELEDTPPMTLDVALRSPIYSISLDSDVRTCLVCARKLLKNSKMVEVHLKSGTHNRRFKRFCDLAQKPKYASQDPRMIVAALNSSSANANDGIAHEGGLSRREAKRRHKLEAIKKKREITKKIIQRKKKQKASQGDENAEKSDSKHRPTASSKGSPQPSKIEGKVSTDLDGRLGKPRKKAGADEGDVPAERRPRKKHKVSNANADNISSPSSSKENAKATPTSDNEKPRLGNKKKRGSDPVMKETDDSSNAGKKRKRKQPKEEPAATSKAPKSALSKAPEPVSTARAAETSSFHSYEVSSKGRKPPKSQKSATTATKPGASGAKKVAKANTEKRRHASKDKAKANGKGKGKAGVSGLKLKPRPIVRYFDSTNDDGASQTGPKGGKKGAGGKLKTTANGGGRGGGGAKNADTNAGGGGGGRSQAQTQKKRKSGEEESADLVIFD